MLYVKGVLAIGRGDLGTKVYFIGSQKVLNYSKGKNKVKIWGWKRVSGASTLPFIK